MKIDAEKYLFNKVVIYLGKYPATKKKIEEYLDKTIKNKKTYQRAIFPEGIDKSLLIENIIFKLDKLNMINEDLLLESTFHYYEQSLFSIRKIKYKLFLKGFDKKDIDSFISNKLEEDPDLEIEILKKYVQKKNLSRLDLNNLKKKLYQQSFSEGSIYKIIKE